MLRQRQNLAAVLLLFISAAICSQDLSNRWIGYKDEDGAFFHFIVDNYHRYGLGQTELAQILNVEEAPQEKWDVYVHFPQLLPVLMYLGTELWGNSEFSLRLVMWFSTLIAAALVYKLMATIFNAWVGIWGLAFYGLAPMVVFTSRVPEYEPLATMFMLAALLAYIYGLRRPPGLRWPVVATLMVSLAALTGWAVYIFSALLFGHALLFGQRKHKIVTLAMGMAVGLMGILFVMHIEFSTPHSLETLINRYEYRTSTTDGDPEDGKTFSLLQLAGKALVQMATGYTPTVMVFALLATILLIWQPDHWKKLPIGERLLPSVMILTGLGYGYVTKQAAYHHEYMWYYLGVGLTLSAAPAVGLLWERWHKPLARVLLSILILGFFLGAVRWIEAYRQYDLLMMRYDLGTKLAQVIEPEAKIETNLPPMMAGSFMYYARTWGFDWETDPAEFLAGDDEKYLYCQYTKRAVPEWPDNVKTTILDVEVATNVTACFLIQR